jgi:branched-chain amino acid transport system substrate-binding protein
MKTLSKLLTAVLAIALILTLGVKACADEVSVVKIGFLNPFSGSNAESGMLDTEGARLAVKHINEQGGIKSLGGAKIELIETDSTSDAKQATTACERLITSNSDLSAIVGTGFSGLTLSILPILDEYQIPAVTNSSSDDIVKQGYEYIFKVAPLSSDFGKLQVNFIKMLNEEYNLGLSKVGVVYVNNSYGINTASGVKSIAESAGLEVVVDQSFPEALTDASSLVATLKNAGVEIVMPIAYTNEAKMIYDTMKSMNYDPMIIAGGGGFLWPSLGEALGDNINGTISASSWNWDSKNVTEVPELVAAYEDYEATYGHYMSEHAGPNYLAVWAIKEAIEKCASVNPVDVRNALSELTDTDSPYLKMMQPGTLGFDETGWNTGIKPVLIQWQDNKPRTIWPEEMASRELILAEGIAK